MDTKPTSKAAVRLAISALSLSIVACIILAAGCANDDSVASKSSSSSASFIDTSITSFHNLGWLGAQSHPLNTPLSFPDPEDEESSISPGGLVITNVFDDSVASDAKLSAGQVIVGIGDKWLPIKDDPTIDFIKLLESNVAGDQETTQLKVFNGQSLETIAIPNVTSSLEPAIDSSIPRYQTAHQKGLQHLASRQNEDGSFGSIQNVDQAIQTTCIAGLSFLTAPEDEFKSNLNKCLDFIASQLDEKINTAQADTKDAKKDTKPQAPAGVVMMKMPEFELDPLTAAFVVQLFAESDLQMIDQKWMPRIMGTIGAITKSQLDSGAWNSGSASDDEEDAIYHNEQATFTTNQILLGLGMLERKGMMGNSDTIKKACEYLKKANESRSGIGMDRRLKSTLTAGTAAALLAVNCSVSDSFLKQSVEDGLTRPGECHTSPQLTLPGVVSTAILARQTSPEAWEQFHAETKYWLSSLQLPDGSFQSTPTGQPMLNASDSASTTDSDLESAYYCILLSMPSDKLPKLKAETKSPMMVARDSDGKEAEGSKSAAPPAIPGVPAGAKVMSFSMDDLSGEGSIEDQIKEKLKSMGIEGDIQMGSPGEDDK